MKFSKEMYVQLTKKFLL